MTPTRSAWTALTDAQLLAQCEVDTYRASGPGGQKRNKTSSAVRLRHKPSGLGAIAEESRSQYENKAKALKRLRQRLWLTLREPYHGPSALVVPLKVGRRDERFWPIVGQVLDVLHHAQGRVSDVAASLGVSTGGLIDFLQIEPAVWTKANEMRQAFGHKQLRLT